MLKIFINLSSGLLDMFVSGAMEVEGILSLAELEAGGAVVARGHQVVHLPHQGEGTLHGDIH